MRDRHFLARVFLFMSLGTASTAPGALGLPFSSAKSCSLSLCAGNGGENDLMRPAADARDESSVQTRDVMLRDMTMSAVSRGPAAVSRKAS